MTSVLLQLTGVTLAVLAAGFGALIGAVGTFIVRYYFYRKRQLRRKKNVRLSLIAELEAIERLELWEKITEENPPIPEYEFIPVTVFKANANTIGLLSAEEVQVIVSFYSSVSVFTEHAISDIRVNIPKYLEDATQSGIRNIYRSDKKRALQDEFEELKEKRKTAIRKLEDNL